MPGAASLLTTIAERDQEFYLVHKIAMDISFHIELGIFIPHTALIANQAPIDPEANRVSSGFLPAVSANHRRKPQV